MMTDGAISQLPDQHENTERYDGESCRVDGPGSDKNDTHKKQIRGDSERTEKDSGEQFADDRKDGGNGGGKSVVG